LPAAPGAGIVPVDRAKRRGGKGGTTRKEVLAASPAGASAATYGDAVLTATRRRAPARVRATARGRCRRPAVSGPPVDPQAGSDAAQRSASGRHPS
jgi:hypothetical protein